MESESTIDDILESVGQFRILSVGRSGVGKSSLINRVFGIKDASVSHHKAGVSDIDQEHVSSENGYFVLHDSKGFEPGDLVNFKIVREFLEKRSQPDLPLRDQVHGLWLCTETPTAGGRIFETGDEQLLKFAHKIQLPIVIVFTQYDRLERSKKAELEEDYPDMDEDTLSKRSVEEALEAFKICLQSLERTTRKLGVLMPHHAKVSVRPRYVEDISELVQVTRKVVKERVTGDAWIMWAIAQRASLPVKIETCITKGMGGYTRYLAAGAPVQRQSQLLRDCLAQIHKDIVTCWNFEGEILISNEFKQLMLYVVQDISDEAQPHVSAASNVDRISQFVRLVTADPAPIAPPGVILGLTFSFVQWLSTTVLENDAPVQRLLIAYTVDLIRVLRELFEITLRPGSNLKTTWPDLQVAFEKYERSPSRQRIHESIRSNIPQGGQVVDVNDFSQMLRKLVNE